jgi:hypothetical protein
VNNALGLDDYTPNNIDLSFFSKDEYGATLKSNLEVTRKEMLKTNGKSKYCSHGLELMTGPRLDHIDQNLAKAYDAVMELQQAQWGRDCNDD